MATVAPGYKRTDVGMIPDDWEFGQLAHLSGFITKGSTPTTYGFKWAENGILFLRSECVAGKGLDLEQSMYISLAAHYSLSRSVVRDGDILMTITGNVGRVVLLAGVGSANINQHIARIRITSPTADARYVHYFLSQPGVRRHFESITTGQAYPQISLQQVRDAPVALPSVIEQRAIADALSDVDRLLGKLEALIRKKRAIKRAAMQQLLTSKTRLPGFNGPWATKRLGDHVSFLRTGTNSRAELTIEGPIKYLHYGDIHTSPQLRLNPRVEPMPSLPGERARALDRLRSGDLVFVDASEDLDGVGRSVEIAGASNTELVSGLHTIAARFDKSVLVNGFKALLQFCPAFRKHLRRLAAGTKVYATNRGHISSAKVPLPDVEEQTAIATVLSDMDLEIAALEHRRDKTCAVKQGMMQQLLTGRVRLVEPS